MVTVADVEMEQRISEFVIYIKEFAVNKKDNFSITSKRDKASLLCVDGEVTLDFSL